MIRACSKSGWLCAVLGSGLSALACGDYGTDASHVGSSSAAIVNGIPVTDNRADAVHFTLSQDGSTTHGSGVIYDNEGSVATVLTAAHVVMENGRVVGPFEVSREDDGSVQETVDTIRIVPHPAYRVPQLVKTERRYSQLRGAQDLAVVITEPFSTARDEVELSLLSPVLLLGSNVDYFGYGPTVDEDQSTLGELHTFLGQIAIVNPIRGWDSGVTIGSLITVRDADGGQFTNPGDSGGPVFRAGTRDLVSIHSARGGTDMYSYSVAEVADWIENVRLARGRVANGRFRGKPQLDQLIVVPGDLWTVHVESASGPPLVRSVPRAPGLGVFEALAGVQSGRFNANATRDGLVQLEALPSGRRLVQVLDPGVAAFDPQLALLSNQAYASVSITRLNGDDLDDVRAQLVGGGEHIYYGSQFDGLKGPFGPAQVQSCRNAGPRRRNACGGDNADGSCRCDIQCLTGTVASCCPDAVEVCQSVFEDEFLRSAGQLSSAPTVSPATTASVAPVVKLASSAGAALGILLDARWVLAPKSQSTAAGLTVEQETPGGDVTLPVLSVAPHPDAPLALIRLAANADVQVPADHRVSFYPASSDELLEETFLRAFGRNGANSAFAAVQFPSSAIVAPNRDPSGDGFGFSLMEPEGLFTTAVLMPPGTPVLSPNGALVALTHESTTEAAVTPLGPVEATLHVETPLLAANTVPEDSRPGARYWVEQTIARSQTRDFDADGQQDLWSFQTATPSSFPELQAIPFTAPNGAGSEVTSGPGIADDGNWRFVGRARIGARSVAMVWHELDSGDVQIWQMDSDNQTVARTLDFNVAPPWQLRALGDIDGDGIADWIWTNSLFDTSFFWVMNDFDAFTDIAALASNPADVIRYGQWFTGMPLNPTAGGVAFELVGADHFRTESSAEIPASGPEQAAVDLVWQELGGEATYVWPMSYQHRTCDDIGDPLLLADCLARGDAVLTYELTGTAATHDRPAHWRYSGSADYDSDGQPDLVWHARGAGSPAVDTGRVQLWLSRDDGQFDEVTVTRAGAPLVVDPAAGLEVAVR